MFIRQLSYLLALDKYRHFGRAAESCHVSQPALSNGIRELERELGITIIKRNRTFEGITPEGERVIQWVRQVVASLEGLRQEADLVRSVPQGHLAIGAIPTANHAATLLSAEYREILPQLTLEVTSLSTPEILRRLKAQEIQLGILYERSVLNSMDYDAMSLYSERYVLVASAQASLPRQLDWSEVGELPLCLLSPDMQNRQTLNKCFEAVDARPRVVLQSNDIRVLLAECQSGRAFSIMPLSALPAQYEGAGLLAHPITPEHAEDVCLVRLRRDNQPPLSHAAWQIAGQMDLEAVLNHSLPPNLDNHGLSKGS
ncbi:LysR family transcriptional regulator [Achromobacter anxifer]|uniref:HTH-type transcriptional regulator CynR n=1 Tax=Achromobacter anxifer TaxID=1287737 RepID=A0A6S7DND3_9BURK|nr:LysR family transcriptional regulator [Achromobacter anxifer]MDF8364794.1 LysR family transcriptional regulator [Achromobacter anxifer]CAB3839516.1 HTH-type transcriptional regulator CynR [Achromobacter anxifer]